MSTGDSLRRFTPKQTHAKSTVRTSFSVITSCAFGNSLHKCPHHRAVVPAHFALRRLRHVRTGALKWLALCARGECEIDISIMCAPIEFGSIGARALCRVGPLTPSMNWLSIDATQRVSRTIVYTIAQPPPAKALLLICMSEMQMRRTRFHIKALRFLCVGDLQLSTVFLSHLLEYCQGRWRETHL